MKWIDYLKYLPEIESPKKKLDFNEKLKWTLIVLVLYFLLAVIPLYGLDPNYTNQFQSISILIAARLGSLISLGIGPIVSGSIILQLLNGAEIINIDTKTDKGRRQYQLLQKGFSALFIIFMNSMYVMSGAIPPANNTLSNTIILIVQLVIGGFLLMLFDEIVSKWGFGSGISLFIAAGVSQRLFVLAFSFFKGDDEYFIGRIPLIFQALSSGQPELAFWPFVSILATVIVFMIAVYAQSIKVNIPLTLGRFRGYNMKWPIRFFYTSNIPVIFTTSLIAMIQMVGLMLSNAGYPILGTFVNDKPVSGLAAWLQFPTISQIVSTGIENYIPNLIIYPLFMILGSVGFSILWIGMGGQDPASVADQIYNYGFSIPGYRSSKQVLERVLKRYIHPMTIMGAATVGVLAVFADFFGALTRGTGILLTVMIIYNIYESIAKTGLEGASPAIKKMFGLI